MKALAHDTYMSLNIYPFVVLVNQAPTRMPVSKSITPKWTSSRMKLEILIDSLSIILCMIMYKYFE